MRRSKSRKKDKHTKAKEVKQLKHELKKQKKESCNKYQEWLNLPFEQWSEARLKYKDNVVPFKE
jgi:hypothetical protein